MVTRSSSLNGKALIEGEERVLSLKIEGSLPVLKDYLSKRIKINFRSRPLREMMGWLVG